MKKTNNNINKNKNEGKESNLNQANLNQALTQLKPNFDIIKNN